MLSTTHLHEFKSPDRISSQAPVMSLPLADQKLGSHSNLDSTSHKFMLKGRQSGGMHRGHAWVFRAESYDTMLAWFSDIKSLTEKTGAERKEFIRRSHARSVSAGSHKAGSISSDGGMDEDEADEVPYSATASQAEIPPQAEKLPQRPNPGGRFPSALQTNRDSQVPVSSSSPSSSTGDREIIAAASVLPGSSIPLGNPVPSGDIETNIVRGELEGGSTALLATDPYSPKASKQGLKGVPLHEKLSSAAAADAEGSVASEHAQGIDSSTTPDSAAGHQPWNDPTPHPLPFNVKRQDGKHAEWLTGIAGGAIGATGTEAYQHDAKLERSATQDLELPPVQEATVSAFPSTPSSTQETANQRPLPITADHTSLASEPGSSNNELVDRPSLGSRVATISELHVPGEFPKGNFSARSV